MRAFSEKEKYLTKMIVKQTTFYFRDCFTDRLLKNISIDIPLHEGEVKKVLHSENIEYQEIAEEIVTVIKLIELLESNGLVYRFQVEYPLGNSITIGKFLHENQMQRHSLIVDKKIREQIKENALIQFVVTQELRLFVKKNFKSKEDRMHRSSLIVAWCAVAVALFAALFGSWSANQETAEALQNLNRRLDSIAVDKKMTVYDKSKVTFDSIKPNAPSQKNKNGTRKNKADQQR